MREEKRTPVMISSPHHSWVKEMAKEVKMSMTDILAAMFERAMDDSGFVKGLERERYKMEMQKIQDAKLALAEKERELQKYLKPEREKVAV